MPVLDGFGVLDGLKETETMPAPVVLVITGASRSEIAHLDPRRVHGIMKKPFDPEELAAVVSACAEIRVNKAFGTMAIATMIAGSPLLALLKRFSA
jgi:CheY-like chemotaxis protein